MEYDYYDEYAADLDFIEADDWDEYRTIMEVSDIIQSAIIFLKDIALDVDTPSALALSAQNSIQNLETFLRIYKYYEKEN